MQHRAAYLVILCCVLIHMTVIGSDAVLYHTASDDGTIAYLVSQGMEEERLTAIGLGFSQPIADNSTEEGRAMNRRIEFRAREE